MPIATSLTDSRSYDLAEYFLSGYSDRPDYKNLVDQLAGAIQDAVEGFFELADFHYESLADSACSSLEQK